MIASDLRSLYIRPSTSIPKVSTSDLTEIRRTLEEGPDAARISTLKSLLVALINGERELVEGLVMTLIRFVLPLKDKNIKKLLLLLFENMNKADSEGILKQEFILVCNSWRNDLQHPNEYVRGATLRFLCHLREPELLEPLMPSVRNCLEHEHAYVRKHAIYAVMSIYRHAEFLIPDAPELIESLLSHESEISCQKASFLFLSQTEPQRALNFFNLIADRLAETDGSLQLAVVEFIRNGFPVINDEEMHAKFFKILINLLKKSSSAVAKYESAITLISFSKQSEIIKMAVDCLISLATKEADNSIKLIILSHLKTEILPWNPEIIQSCVLDLLRVLSSPDPTVRKVCLELVAASTTSRVALEVVQFLKKEATKSSNSADSSEYRQAVLDALYKCSMNFSEVGTEVMNAYLELIKNGFINESLVSYMKETLFKYPKLRQTYLFSVISALPNVSDSKSLRSLLWLVGEFSHENGNILAAIQAINSGLGELPMLAVEEKYEASLKAAGGSSEEKSALPASGTPKVSTKILADGTYASEILEESSATSGDGRQLPNIKKLFLDGKFECSGVLADTLSKLMIRLRKSNIDQSQFMALRTRVLLMLTSILRLGGSKYVAQAIDRDSAERVALSIQIIIASGEEGELEKALTVDSEGAFNAIQQREGKSFTSPGASAVEIDDAITFKLIDSTQTRQRTSLITPEAAMNLVLNDAKVTNSSSTTASSANLNRVVQLTGFSDAIYAESYVQMSGKEVLLDLLLVNQTEDTLQNVSIDLVCAGDLKLMEKPAQLTLPPYSFSSCKAIFKVTATNHGQIFGCISYLTGPSGQDSESVILSEVKIDVLEYIKAAKIDEPAFRDIWVLLEWENKISIKVQRAGDLKDFLWQLLKKGNLTCITPDVFMEETGDARSHETSSFLACNLYAKSIFDEEILANLCAEINPKTKVISGHLRLRSKTQGLAVAYGDKLNSLIQKMK